MCNEVYPDYADTCPKCNSVLFAGNAPEPKEEELQKQNDVLSDISEKKWVKYILVILACLFFWVINVRIREIREVRMQEIKKQKEKELSEQLLKDKKTQDFLKRVDEVFSSQEFSDHNK